MSSRPQARDADFLQELILYVVHQVADSGGYTTTIRLVKFLYLIDLEHQRCYGHTLTGLRWIYHLHGPYAFELPNIGTRLGFNLEREEITTRAGHKGTLLRALEPQEFPTTLSLGTKFLVDGILRVWADHDTPALLEYVYSTPPMLNAQRGDPLDFSVVPSGSHYYELQISVGKRAARQLRESLRSHVQADASDFVRPDTVSNEVLAEGLRALDKDETPLPTFMGVSPSVDADQLRATLPRAD